MELVTRKKLEIFVEAHALVHVERMLHDVGAKGWSVFNGVEGAGSHGAWRQSAIDGGGDMHLVIAITNEPAARKALAWLTDYFSSYRGLVTLSDVQVLRPERF
ncbi:MAG: DUF190 domain-containing protein [Hyphomonadaceae bacterium]|nr:DUF190 domain-containing protein [Hyphomonadaceae bacterium]